MKCYRPASYRQRSRGLESGTISRIIKVPAMQLISVLKWESLRSAAHYCVRRSGRYRIAELVGEHAVLSTSIRNGGQSRALRYLSNHQSCEGAMHTQRHDYIKQLGQE